MIFLYVFLSIVAFIILLLCIKVVAVADYNEKLIFTVKWLFLKFQIYPEKEKTAKDSKEEKEEEKKPPKERKKEETKKRSNPIKSFYENQGFSGVLELISNTASAVTGLFKRVYKAVTIENLFIRIRVSSSDPAKTAIDYGKVCAIVFPAAGSICSTMRVREYDLDVSPDFMDTTSKAGFNIVISVIPIKITNAAVILAFQLLFKVLLKLFLGSRKRKNEESTQLKGGK